MSKVSLFTPNNRLKWTETMSNWGQSNATVLETSTAVLAPDGTASATKIMETSANSVQHALYNIIASSNDLFGEQIVSEFFWKAGERNYLLHQVWEDAGRPLISFRISSGQSVQEYGYVDAFSLMTDNWFYVRIVSSETPRPSGSGNLYSYFFTGNSVPTVQYTGTSGYGFYLWHPNLGPAPLAPYVATTTSWNIGGTVNIDTEWDSTSGSEKYFDESKTPAGARARYVYGNRERYKLNADMLSTRDLHTINKWWRDGTPILMRDADDPFAAITSVFIDESSPPVAKQVKPYENRWTVSINLEGY